MKKPIGHDVSKKVLVIGDGQMATSIAICFGQGGFQVTVITKQPETKAYFNQYREMHNRKEDSFDLPSVSFTDVMPDGSEYFLAILSDNDGDTFHQKIISDIENTSNGQRIIGVCTDYLPLTNYQKSARFPENILGMNWTEPVYTTLFLELVENDKTNPKQTMLIKELAIKYLNKDPYVIKNETGVRSKMMAAMAREAFYLIENEYAEIEDIDRACRNDAGTYSAFAGNFRYMDLMGTYAYGIVMKALNKELSNAVHIPQFFTEKISQGKLGMKYREGLYTYPHSSAIDWTNKMHEYSLEVRRLMDQYPFGYLNNEEERQS